MTNKVLALVAILALVLGSYEVKSEEMNVFKDVEEATGLDIGFHLSQGFTWNTTAGNNFNGPVSFNDRANDYQMNQAYLYFDKEVEQSADDFDLGGRVDLLYGTDAGYTASTGFDDQISNSSYYRFVLPQAYLKANLPILNGTSLQVGHFYTLIGYEVVPSPMNFFYSHAYTMQYGEPFTHWGALASTSFNDGEITLTGGAVRGWDNFSDNGEDSYSGLGSVSYAPDDDTAYVFSLISGDEATAMGEDNRTMYSFVYSRQLGDKLSYVFQHDMGIQDVGSSSQEWYGLNNYLIYTVDEALSAGLRLEWFRDQNGSRVAGLRSGAGGVAGNYYGVTAGANYSICPGFMIRPEVRYDRSEGGRVFDGNTDKDQILVAADVILKF